MVIKNRQDILSNIKLLYNYKDSENMDLITAWNPDEDQWWITGFNPECKGEKADAKNQVMIGSVDFSGNENMYDNFIIEMNKVGNDEKRKYLIYDEQNKTIWICWHSMEDKK